MWDLRSGRCLQTLDWKLSEGHTGVVRCLQVDAWRIVSAADDRTVKVHFHIFVFIQTLSVVAILFLYFLFSCRAESEYVARGNVHHIDQNFIVDTPFVLQNGQGGGHFQKSALTTFLSMPPFIEELITGYPTLLACSVILYGQSNRDG